MTFKVEPADGIHIGEAAERLGVTTTYLRLLERKGLVPAPRRDVFGRLYTKHDLAMLRALGVGSRPDRLRTVQEVLDGSR